MHAFGRRNHTRFAGTAILVAAALTGACASSNGSAPDRGAVGPICADCATETAGGQTTDFGSGGGCQGSTRTPVDVDTARSLGFTLVDQLDRTFDTSLVWTPRDTTGQPATGYDAHTTLHVEMSLLGVDRVTAVVENCPDYFAANVGVTLSTADQALSIGGVLRAIDGTVPDAEGSIDLSYGVGTLGLHPDPQSEPLAGKLSVEMLLWPSGARGQLSLSLVDASYQPSGDVAPAPRYLYAPLDAKFPDDTCDDASLPFAPDEPGAAPNGQSASDVAASMASVLGSDPLPGAWSDTGDVTVTTSLGTPTDVCVGWNGNLAMKVPLHVTSSDGRAHLDELAHAGAVYDADGNLTNEFVEATHDDAVSRDAFAATSGISGVNFGDATAATWSTTLYLVSADRPDTGPYGELVVEGIDPNATPTGSPDDLATLHWWK